MTTPRVTIPWPGMDRLDQRAALLQNQLQSSILSIQDLLAELAELRAGILTVFEQNNYGLDQVQAVETPQETPNAQSTVEETPGATGPNPPGTESAPGQGEEVPPGKQRVRRRRAPQG